MRPRSQFFHADGPVGTGKDQNSKLFWRNADLDWFPFLIRTVINRIDQSLLNRGVGEVPKSFRLWPMGIFDYRFLPVVPNNEIDSLAENGRQRNLRNSFSSNRSPPAPSGNHTASICVAGKKWWGAALKNSSPTFLGNGTSEGPPTMFMRRPKASIEIPAARAGSAATWPTVGKCDRGITDDELGPGRRGWLPNPLTNIPEHQQTYVALRLGWNKSAFKIITEFLGDF